MRTIQNELVRTGLASSKKQEPPKAVPNFETLIIGNVIKSEVTDRCKSIRKGIKEKYPLFKDNQPNGNVKILYSKKGEKKMSNEMNKEVGLTRLNFYKSLLSILVKKPTSSVELNSELSKNPHGGEANKLSLIRNFLTVCKWSTQGMLTSDNFGKWYIKGNVLPETIITLYLQNYRDYGRKIPKRTQKFEIPEQLKKRVPEQPKKQIPEVPGKKLEIQKSFSLVEIINLIKSIDFNITITLK